MDILKQTSQFTKIEQNIAEDLLKEFAPNELVYSTSTRSHPIENKKFDKNFCGRLVRQPQFRNCTFTEVDFSGIDGTASGWINCKINNSLFKDAGMNYSDFSGSHFLLDTRIINTGCSECNFTNTLFQNSVCDGTTFDRSFFINSIIKDCKFTHCSFIDGTFRNTAIENTVLTQASLEYATFQNITWGDNTILPFWGILKSYNGLDSIKKTQNKVYIQASINGSKILCERFIEMLNDLQPYFWKRKDFFVLANINIFLGHQKTALKYMLEGLRYSLDNRDFRMIRHLCELAANNHFFTREQLHLLYNILTSNDTLLKMNDHEYQIYIDELDTIKRLLIDNPYSMPQMVITYKTDYPDDTYEYLFCLVNFIEKSIKKYLPQASYYFTVHRNSPPTAEIFLSDTLINLYYFFVATTPLLIITAGKALSGLKSLLETQGIDLDNKIKRKELERKDLEIEHMRLENEKLRQELNKSNHQNKLDNDQSKEDILLENICSVSFKIKSVNTDEVPIREFEIEKEK